MSERYELKENEAEQVVGGYRRPEEKEGFLIYQIEKGTNLTRIATKYHTSVEQLLRWNPKITNKNRIYAGDYLYIKIPD